MAEMLKGYSAQSQVNAIKVNVAASQTIKQGDLVQINATSRKAEAAVAASATLLGIAEHDITTTGTVTDADNLLVTPLRDRVIRIAYVGTTKTTLVETDLYATKFDLSDKKTLNLDDTTGGMLLVLAYNNTKKTADVVVINANLAIN